MLLRMFVLLPLACASPLGDLIASRLKVFQSLQAKFNESRDATQGATQKSGFYPGYGPSLTMRELIAKETFRLMAQVALDRMPARRHDDSYEMYYPKKKKKGHLQGRQFFESEEFILFLIGLGLASVLGMATMMAPINQLMYSNAYGAVPAGIQAYPAGPAFVAGPQGRRRRSVPRTPQIERAHATLRSASHRFGRLRSLTASQIK